MKASWLMIALLVFPVAAAATSVYRWVDKDGSVVFSDQPHKGAQRIDVPPANTYEPGKLPPVTPAAGASSSGKSGPYREFAIRKPADGATVRQNNGDVSVQLAIQPPLKRGEGQTIALSLDGSQLPRQYTGTQMVLPNVDRGTHTLEAQVVDADGNAVAATPTVTFHLMRYSRLQAPNRPGAKPPANPNVLSPNPNVRSQNPNVLSPNPNVLSPHPNVVTPVPGGGNGTAGPSRSSPPAAAR